MRPIDLAAIAILALACSGSDRSNNAIEGPARSTQAVTAQAERQVDSERRLSERGGATRELPAKQILFGDLHVHTTYSPDAFTLALPIMGGEGAHTLSDACDFARYCSEVDFFSFNDHAESLIPDHWQATKEAVRACNASAGATDPDLMVFAGWEWTQVGLTPESHWGHKNVIFLGQEEDELPARAINSRPYGSGIGLFGTVRAAVQARFLDPLNWSQYLDLEWLVDQLEAFPECPRDVPTRELPPDCHENAPSPDVLYHKLDQWGFDALVIPHGTAWGSYTPPTTSWDKALSRRYHDEDKVRLVEIMSGHGNSEEYRSWDNFTKQAKGELVCPAPTADFLPCCWRAGELMRERCGDLPAAECEARVAEAQQLAMRASVAPAFIFPDSQAEDWLDCDQCRDCFKPSFNYRPKESIQYAMSLASAEEIGSDGRPLRFRFGFIGSTDDHTSRPGTGYKQYARKKMTFSPGMTTGMISPRAALDDQMDAQRAQAVDVAKRAMDSERVTSFTYPGGIVAVHAAGRSRSSVWAALQSREVYGTSGPKILLWFDLQNAPGGPAPMGSAVALDEAPRFEVRAAGAFAQKPGCPASSHAALSPARLEALCAGECDNPGELRHPIEAIEIIRIRPGTEGDAGERIEDPWRRFPCEPDPAGCTVTFQDDEFVTSGRDTLYYARVLQPATPAINGDLLRPERDADGNVKTVRPCFGDYRVDPDDDCLAPARERAWSSPIFVDQARGRATGSAGDG
ncbi:MAG: hypothetical protein CL910_07430 [Deltaproteobacteria bacterium]|nr:hypothetical protein [Deltaproteobacteria bacterium]